jgi:hypothetical protein
MIDDGWVEVKTRLRRASIAVGKHRQTRRTHHFRNECYY